MEEIRKDIKNGTLGNNFIKPFATVVYYGGILEFRALCDFYRNNIAFREHIRHCDVGPSDYYKILDIVVANSPRRYLKYFLAILVEYGVELTNIFVYNKIRFAPIYTLRYFRRTGVKFDVEQTFISAIRMGFANTVAYMQKHFIIEYNDDVLDAFRLLIFVSMSRISFTNGVTADKMNSVLKKFMQCCPAKFADIIRQDILQ